MPLPSLLHEVPLFWRRSQAQPIDTLVQRLQDGESAAVAEAFDLHNGVVRAFARRLIGDNDAAEDLVQDVFVALPKAIKRFDGRSSLRTFVVAIAINHARHHVRAAMRRRAAWQRASVHAELSGQGQNQPLQPDQQTSNRQLAQLLSAAMDALPLDQRVAFVLCEVEERTSVEAAALIGVPEATVRTRLFHARRKLREMLEQKGLR